MRNSGFYTINIHNLYFLISIPMAWLLNCIKIMTVTYENPRNETGQRVDRLAIHADFHLPCTRDNRDKNLMPQCGAEAANKLHTAILSALLVCKFVWIDCVSHKKRGIQKLKKKLFCQLKQKYKNIYQKGRSALLTIRKNIHIQSLPFDSEFKKIYWCESFNLAWIGLWRRTKGPKDATARHLRGAYRLKTGDPLYVGNLLHVGDCVFRPLCSLTPPDKDQTTLDQIVFFLTDLLVRG